MPGHPGDRSRDPPLRQCIRRRSVIMWFEHPLDRRADHDLLLRIAEQVTQHADVASVRQLDEYGDVGAVVPQRRMHRMPTARPGPDAAFAVHRDPSHVP
jgi:hypothetical protein